MSDLIITPSSGKIDFIYQSGQEISRLESITIDPTEGLVFSGKISASSVNSPLNITATSSNINYPFIFASSGTTGAKSLLMDSAGGTYNPSTNLATIDISGTSSWATNAVTNANLTGDVTSVGNATTIANSVVTNAKLANSSVTIGSTAISLGATPTVSIAGLTSVTSTTFVGALTGTATTASYANALNAANSYTVAGITGTLTGNVTGTATTASYANNLNAANQYTVGGITGSHFGTSSWATNATNALTATNSTQLNGQAASYYTDINARLGYTPVNKAGDTVTGNLTVNGNFAVNGSFTAFSASNVYISSSQLYIEDNILTLNAFSPYLRYAGVEMYDSGSGTLSSLLWDGEADYFFLTGSSVNGKIITGPDGQTNLSANFVPKATAGYKLGNSLIYDDGTNVGIGTTTTAAKFVVNGGTVNTTTYTTSESRIADGSIHLMKTVAGGIFESIRAMNVDTTAGTTVRVLAAATSDPFNNANGGKVFIDAIRTSTNMDLAFSLNDVAGVAPVERVRFMGSGNVGIGTTSPVQRLDLSGSLRIRSTGTYSDPTDNAGFINYDSTGGIFTISARSNGGNTYMAFRTSNAGTGDERIRIINDGNVGIGTTSPAAKLQVNSTTAGATLLRTDGTNGTLFSVVDDLSDSLMSVNNSAGLPVLEVFADDRIVMGQYGQNDFVLVNNKVGIGTNNPSFKLDITGSFGLNAGTNDGNWPFIVADSITSGGTNRYALNKIGAMGFNYADSYAQLQLIGANGAYIDFGNAAVDDSDARVIYYSNNRLDIQYGSIITLNSTGVGIGTTVPGTSLEVYAIPATSTTLRQMLIINTDFASATGTGFGGSIVFRGRTPGNLLRDNAQISAYNEDIGDNGYALGFYTRPSDGGGLQQRLTILRAGNVGIGTVGPGAKLEISGSSNSALLNIKSPVGSTILYVSGSGAVGVGTSAYTSTGGNGYLMLKNVLCFVPDNTANLNNRNWSIGTNGQFNGDLYFVTSAESSSFPNDAYRISFTRTGDIITNGSIGVGIANPVAKLQVNGNISGSSFTSSISNAVGFLGTSSWATNATNALQLGGTAAADYVTLTGTQTLTGKTITGTFTGNLTGTASWASNAVTALNGGVTSVSGTANQVIVSGNTGAVTFSLPQSIHTTATPTFTSVSATTFTGALTGTATTASYANALNPANSYTVTNLTASGVGKFFGNIAIITDASANDYSLIGHSYAGTTKAFTGYNGGSAIYGGESTIPTRIQAGGQYVISVLANGNVGIGTTSPLSKLHISGSGQTIMRLDSDTTTNVSQFQIKAASDAVLIMGMFGGSATGNNYGVTAAGQAYIGTTTLGSPHPTSLVIATASPIPTIFSTNNVERMRIDGTGLVGIGTTVPSTLLHAYGSDGRYFTYSGTSGAFTIQRNAITTGGATPVLSLINTQGMDSSTGRGTSIQLDLGYGGSSSAVGTAARGARIAALGETVYDATAANQNAVLAFFTSTAGSLTEKLRIRSDGSLSPITVSSTTVGATLLRTDGTNGTLFSVVDDLSDSLMSVNNSAGLPVLEVFADDRIVAGQYGQNDFVVVNNKVGIGTNNPLAKLHVTSSTSIPSAIFMGGNVGIGTTSPSYRLQLGNLTAVSTATPEILSLGGTWSNSAGANVKLRVYDDNGTNIGGMNVSSGQMEVNTWSTGKLAFYRGTTQTAIIDASGNLGVGTTSPNAKLDSYFALNAITFNYLATNLNVNSPIPVYGFDVTSGVETRSIKAGIGYERHLTNGRGTLHIYNRSSDDTSNFSGTRATAGDIKMSIDNSGNVGIGTTLPTTALHVVGVISGSSFTGAGTGLTGTAASLTAGTANSVAWTNVSGRPTAVSSFTNDSGYLTSVGTIATASYANTLNPANNYIVNSLTEGGYLAYPLREYVINLSGQSATNFYPVAIDNPPGTDTTWHNQFSIDMANQGGAAAYNMHSMYGEVRGQGWTDQNLFYRVFHNFYDSAERSILGVWRGTQTFYGVVVYLRGGKNYYVRTTSRSAVGYSAAQTLGSSVFAIKNAAGADVSGTSANIAEMLNLINNPSGFYHSDNAYIGTNQVVHLGTTSAPNLSIGGSAATATSASFATTAATATTAANGGVTSIAAGTSITVSSTTGAVTVNNSAPNATHTGEVTGATALTISSSAITTVKIADAAVTTAKIADAAVTTIKIADANVTTAKIADAAITNLKLANSAVTVGTTSISLGGAQTTIGGLVSVTSNAFVGPLTGNVTGNLTGTADTANALTTNNSYTVGNLTVNTMAQLKGVKETYVDVNPASNVVSIDLNAGTVFRLNYNAVINSFTISNLTLSKVNSFTLISIPAAGAGGISFTFTSYTLVWAGNSVPYATQTGGKFDVFSFIYDGSRWYGFVGGLNY